MREYNKPRMKFEEPKNTESEKEKKIMIITFVLLYLFNKAFKDSLILIIVRRSWRRKLIQLNTRARNKYMLVSIVTQLIIRK